jgi:thiol-disulfide isomerase/thioredoxin
MPHLYWNDLLLDGAALCLVAALALFGGSFVLRRFSKKRLRLSSLASFVLGIALVAANYGLIFVDAYSIAKPGKRAPDLHVRVADGSEVTLDRLRGKIVVLNFFATWCPPCMQEMPHL